VGTGRLTRALATGLLVVALAACGQSAPSPTVPATSSATIGPSPTGSGSEVPTVCQIDMLAFVIADWEGAAGTAHSTIVIGLRDGAPACTFDGPVQIGLEGPSAPMFLVQPPALPASELPLRPGPIDPGAARPGQIAIPLAMTNWCPQTPPVAGIRIGIGPLGQSALLTTTWPTPACTKLGAPAGLEVGPIAEG
jgi:hypothetical protein